MTNQIFKKMKNRIELPFSVVFIIIFVSLVLSKGVVMVLPNTQLAAFLVFNRLAADSFLALLSLVTLVAFFWKKVPSIVRLFLFTFCVNIIIYYLKI